MIYNIIEQHIWENNKMVKELVFDGLLCLTNLQVLENKVVHLKKQENDKHYRAIQIIKILWQESEITFYHTHYSNTNEWSKLHLQETKEYLMGKKVYPIIVGDLNILKPEVIKEVLVDKFECSYDIKQYVSFPSKNEVLDYVVVPKGLYKFNDIRCDYDNCSDHLALIVDISII
jgi:hypothetical protein